ncbi:predicted protein [Lichtheimia corymbifera JMRC:FSU:9682]|uniref:Uncharacterized protein n=1 Tax=Lichtheimia corymbifera JMRC:FSU:9682 TaxID=1263082 RepID=A0A068S5T5_9FUNG|nr:predicted protein [Lichtheimia corymbifera JMRC:FSU:9682]
MNNSISTDLCSQPTQPVSTEKYTKLVQESTTQLHQPIQSILTTLDLRASALSKLANFESALRDATVIQQLSPSSALGYIRAATIYSEQGKQHHVIVVCNRGLDLVNSSDPDYATLQHIKADAMERQNRRVDFITQLPINIVATTLIPMFTDTFPLDAFKPCPYLHVSNL